MSNNYVDKYGRYHNKPCINGESSSNNGWIYTAYASKLEIPLYRQDLNNCYRKCMLHPFYPRFNRSPGQETPPASRDEVLGLVELGILIYDKEGSWNFSPYPIPKFNPIKLARQLWQLRPTFEYSVTINTETNTISNNYLQWKHRNYFWQNNLDQLYCFAFSVPLTDRHFILQKCGKFNLFYWAVAKVDSWFGKPSGIRYLKYGKSKEGMLKEFPEDHPFKKA